MTLLEQQKLSEAYKKVTESPNFDVMEIIRNNPETVNKLKSGELNAGDLADQAQFIHAKSLGIDPNSSTNSASYQALKKTANIAQRKLQNGGELSALDYASRARPSAERNMQIHQQYLSTLPKVSTPDPVGAKQDADALTHASTGKSIEQLNSELNEADNAEHINNAINEAKKSFSKKFGMTIDEAFLKKCCCGHKNCKCDKTTK